MYRFKQFLTEGEPWPDLKDTSGSSVRDYASKVTPRVASGFGGALGTNRLTAALRWGKDVIAGKPGGAHSELGSFAKERGKPDEMGFVGKPSGSTEVGPHQGAFFSRQQATRIGNKHSELKNDPTPEDPGYPSQSYDFKPEGGKKNKKKIAEMYTFKEFFIISEAKTKRTEGGSMKVQSDISGSFGHGPEALPLDYHAGAFKNAAGKDIPAGRESKNIEYSAPSNISSKGQITPPITPSITPITQPTNKDIFSSGKPYGDPSFPAGQPGATGTQSGTDQLRKVDFGSSKSGPEDMEGGKKSPKKKLKEMYTFKQFLVLEEKKKAKSTKPAKKKDDKAKLSISNKERTHAGMSYYSPWETS